jgi:hypothetical protein
MRSISDCSMMEMSVTATLFLSRRLPSLFGSDV